MRQRLAQDVTGFDWPGLMRAGLHGLRLRPDEFWALTPAELAIMLGQVKGVAPMSHAQLDQLLKIYPDQEGQNDE